MGDIVVGWFIVPGALAAVLGSTVTLAWQHLAGKHLRQLESHLRKQEETYRLAQSPRVQAAIELWSALRAYERAFAAMLNPVQRITTPDGSTREDWPVLREEHRRGQRREWRSAWKALGPARDKAEVLLPPTVFELFDAVFRAYAKAHEEQEWMHLPGLTNHEEVAARRDAYRREGGAQRKAALQALHAMMGTVERE
jgi:hypothetical protein